MTNISICAGRKILVFIYILFRLTMETEPKTENKLSLKFFFYLHNGQHPSWPQNFAPSRLITEPHISNTNVKFHKYTAHSIHHLSEFNFFTVVAKRMSKSLNISFHKARLFTCLYHNRQCRRRHT